MCRRRHSRGPVFISSGVCDTDRLEIFVSGIAAGAKVGEPAPDGPQGGTLPRPSANVMPDGPDGIGGMGQNPARCADGYVIWGTERQAGTREASRNLRKGGSGWMRRERQGAGLPPRGRIRREQNRMPDRLTGRPLQHWGGWRHNLQRNGRIYPIWETDMRSEAFEDLGKQARKSDGWAPTGELANRMAACRRRISLVGSDDAGKIALKRD